MISIGWSACFLADETVLSVVPESKRNEGHVTPPPLRMAPLVLLAVFLVLLLVGITLDEPSRVLEQARSICLACIGIG